MARRYVTLVVVAVIMGMLAIRSEIEDTEAHTGCNVPWARPDGMWVKPENDPAQYLIEDCRKRHFLSPLDVVSYYFPSATFRTISNEEDAALLPGFAVSATIRAREGTLFRYTPTGAIYIIDEMQNGAFQKRYIDINGWNAYFAPCGYGSGSIIETSDLNYLSGYPDGTTVTAAFPRPDGQLIKSAGSTTVYLLQTQFKRQFSSDLARFSYNFIQPICTTTTSSYSTGAMIKAREGTRFKGSGAAQYVIERSGTSYNKRWITSQESLTFYGLDAHTLWPWPDAEVNSYTETFHAHPVKTNWARVWNKTWLQMISEPTPTTLHGMRRLPARRGPGTPALSLQTSSTMQVPPTTSNMRLGSMERLVLWEAQSQFQPRGLTPSRNSWSFSTHRTARAAASTSSPMSWATSCCSGTMA